MKRLPFLTQDHLAPAVAALRAVLARHGVAVLPTETFYGLAVDPRDGEAVARVFALKRREETKSLLVVAADLGQVSALAELLPLWWSRLAAVWPAALTVVLPARAPLPGSGTTVAMRVPAHALLRKLLAEVGPLTATSANPSGQRPARRVEELGGLAEAVDLILDGGPTPGGLPSTLLDLTVTPPRILRSGAFAVPDTWLV